MPHPIVAIVGRPNVGKSTLFNRLIGEQRAVTHDAPGTTRDRIYGVVDWSGREFVVVDTGGIGLELDESIFSEVVDQAKEAIREADVVVFLVDARSGPTGADAEVAELLRRSERPIVLAANKVENPRMELSVAEFYALGLGEPSPISATQGLGIGDLLDAVLDRLPPPTPSREEPEAAVSIAIVGRPNVGKSSLLNTILGKQRSIVSPRPGTTRDPIDSVLQYDDQTILLIDTAGIRRRGRIERGVEKYSVLRALRAIERADVVALVIDAGERLTAQDTHVAGFAADATKGLIVVVNKWDLVEKDSRTADAYAADLRQALSFAPYAAVIFVSALTGQRVRRVLELALQIQQARQKRVPTSALNSLVREAFAGHRLTSRGRPLKVFYATQADVAPPTFVLFVNEPEIVHFSYRRYLENQLREAFGFEGTAIRLVFRGRSEPD